MDIVVQGHSSLQVNGFKARAVACFHYHITKGINLDIVTNGRAS